LGLIIADMKSTANPSKKRTRAFSQDNHIRNTRDNSSSSSSSSSSSKSQPGVVDEKCGIGNRSPNPIIHSATENRHMSEIFDHESQATLVICTFWTHWEEELRGHVRDGVLKVVTIVDRASHQKLKPEEAISADIVIVTKDFIMGKYYKSQKMHLKSGLLHFNQINWKRIVYDAGGNEPIPVPILWISSHYRWYLTSRPLSDEGRMWEILPRLASFLKIALFQREGESDVVIASHHRAWNRKLSPLGGVLLKAIHGFLQMRHTHFSVMRENYRPPPKHRIQLIEFHPVERVLYEMVVAGKRPGWERKALQCCRNIKDVDFGRSADTSFNPKLKVFGRTLRDFLSVIIEIRAALLRASIAPPPSQLEIEREVAVIGLDPGGPPGFAERVAEWEERQRRAAPTLQRSMQQRYGVKLVSVLEFVMSAVRKTQRSRIIIVGDKSGGALYDCKVLLRSAGVGTAHFEGNLRHRTKGDENNRFILAERQSFSPPARWQS